RRARALQRVSRRVLARARARPLSGGVRRRPDRERLARRPDSGGVRGRGALADGCERHPRGDQRGELRLQAFGVTEPTAGSDTTSIQTAATRSDNGYVVNGQKIWTSRALYSDLMLLLARTT